MSSDVGEFRPSTDIRLSELSDHVTIVTAYYYIPEYKKRGSTDQMSTHDMYRQVGYKSVFVILIDVFVTVVG